MKSLLVSNQLVRMLVRIGMVMNSLFGPFVQTQRANILVELRRARHTKQRAEHMVEAVATSPPSQQRDSQDQTHTLFSIRYCISLATHNIIAPLGATHRQNRGQFLNLSTGRAVTRL